MQIIKIIWINGTEEEFKVKDYISRNHNYIGFELLNGSYIILPFYNIKKIIERKE